MSTQNNYFCLYHWLSTHPNVPVHISWLVAARFDLFLRCVWCIILLEKGKHCGVFRDEGCNTCDIFVPTRLSVSLQSFGTKLGIVVHHHEPECHAKKLDFIFKVKVIVWAYIIKIWQFLLYLLLVLNQRVFCNQTQFECRSSYAKKCPVKMLDCCVQGQCHSQG